MGRLDPLSSLLWVLVVLNAIGFTVRSGRRLARETRRYQVAWWLCVVSVSIASIGLGAAVYYLWIEGIHPVVQLNTSAGRGVWSSWTKVLRPLVFACLAASAPALVSLAVYWGPRRRPQLFWTRLLALAASAASFLGLGSNYPSV